MNGHNSMHARILIPAFFWGIVWGLGEATAGHFLHLVRVPGLAGFIMFPAGFVMMSRAFAWSGNAASIFVTACLAASVKLTDLLLPGADVFAVVNPAQAILLESLSVIAIYSFRRRSGRITLLIPVLASFSWRAVYILSGVISTALFSIRNLLQAGAAPVVEFLILDSLVNGALIFVISRIVVPTRMEFVRFQEEN